MDMAVAKQRFRQQQSHAKRRGIEFKLTFEQWCDACHKDWGNRGTRSGQLVMCRNKDQGPYEVGNFRIDTNRSNIQEAAMLYRVKKHAESPPKPQWKSDPSTSYAAPDDWMRRGRVFDEYVESEED